MLIGIFHHPAPEDLPIAVESKPVARTWSNEAQAFVDAYAVKSLSWLKGLGVRVPPAP